MDVCYCDHCGGVMVPGVPGDVYCPNDACMKLEMQRAFKMIAHMRENDERNQLAKLKAKYETPETIGPIVLKG